MRIWSFLVLFYWTYAATAQSDSLVLAKADTLFHTQQYASAFQVLDEDDPGNAKPLLVVQKVEILLNGYVKTEKHESFVLKNLQAGESLSELRGKEAAGVLFNYDIPGILGGLIQRFPAQYKLYKALGDFYYEVNLRYGKNWNLAPEEILNRLEYYYQQANDHGEGDYMTYYVLGYMRLLRQQYRESLPYLQRSIGLNQTYASAYYNLAYAYLYLNQRDSALRCAGDAFGLYKDWVYKADAARMMGFIYKDMSDTSNSLKYYELSDSIAPGNYFTLSGLLEFYLQNNNPRAGATLDRLFNMAPTSVDMYLDLMAMYVKNGKGPLLKAFFERQLNQYSGNSLALGNLHFFIARFYIEQLKNNAQAKPHLKLARDLLARNLDPGNDVLRLIDEKLKEMRKEN